MSRLLDRDGPTWPLVAILPFVVWGILRAAFYIGWYIEDAPGFAVDAAYWAAGEWTPRSYLPGLRIGTYVPAGLAIWALGKTEFALSVWPLLSSMAGVVSLIGIGRALQLKHWGLLASLIWVAYPGDVIFSTVLMPDAVQTGWFLVAVLLMLRGTSSARAGVFASAASGLVCGFCYLVRENAVLLLPVLLAGPLVLPLGSGSAARWPRVLAIVAGFSVVMLGEATYYWMAIGAFGHRFEVSQAYYGVPDALVQHGLNADSWTIPGSLFPPLEWYRISAPFLTLNPGQAYHAYLFVLGAAAWLVGVSLIRRMESPERRTLLWLSVWLWVPLLYHQFGSQSLTSYVPMHRLPRQLVLYAPPMAVAIAWTAKVVSRVLRQRSQWQLRIAAACLLAGLTVHAMGVREGLQIQSRIVRESTSIHDRLVATLTGAAGRVLVDAAETGLLDYFLNPLHEHRVLVQDLLSWPSCEGLENTIVVTHSNPGWRLQPLPARLAEATKRLPCLESAPGVWVQVQAAPWLPERIYQVPMRSVAQTTR